MSSVNGDGRGIASETPGAGPSRPRIGELSLLLVPSRASLTFDSEQTSEEEDDRKACKYAIDH